MHKMMPKSLMDAYSESRQGVLAVVKYILATAKTKFVAARIFIIKGPAEQPKPTCCSENPSLCNENTLS